MVQRTWFGPAAQAAPVVIHTLHHRYVDGSIGLEIDAPAGRTVVVEASIDQANLTPIGTYRYDATSFHVRDPASTDAPVRFYRARAQP